MKIKDYIKKYKHQITYNELKKTLQVWIILFFLLLLLLCIVESIFYLSSWKREKIYFFLILLFFTPLAYSYARYLIKKYSLFNNLNEIELASIIGKNDIILNDKLKNNLQLQNNLAEIKNGKDLAKLSISKIEKHLDYEATIKKLKVTPNIFFYIFIVCIVSILFFSNSINSALDRLSNPTQKFIPPLPFRITSLTNQNSLLAGDSLMLKFDVQGEAPDSLNLYIKNRFLTKKITLKKEGDNTIYSYSTGALNTSFNYWLEYKNPKWLSSWDKIQSDNKYISIIKRPKIKKINIISHFPEYINKEPISYNNNLSEIEILYGSTIKLSGITDTKIKEAWIINNDSIVDIKSSNYKFSGDLKCYNNQKIKLYFRDFNNIVNNFPPTFNVIIKNDNPPIISILEPSENFELNENNKINILAQVSDDFGLSKSWIEYTIIKPMYLNAKIDTHKKEIFNLIKNQRIYDIIEIWDISNLEIWPEDQLKFTINVSDNNTLTGPTISQSKVITAIFPSIKYLYDQIEEIENETINELNTIQESIDEIILDMDEVKNELLKSDDLTWDKKQSIKENLSEVNDIFKELEKIQDNISSIQNQGLQNNLFEPELAEKFDHFQNLISNILTDEILQTMESLEEAMKELDPEKLVEAMNNFDYDLENFEDQLDRFINMFEMAMAEQNMNELIKKMESLFNQQEELIDNLNNESNIKELASDARAQEQKLSDIKKSMEETQESMKQISENTTKNINELLNTSTIDSTQSQLENVRKKLQANNINDSKINAKMAQTNINNMLNELNLIQKQFHNELLSASIEKIYRIIFNLVDISHNQEKINIMMKSLNRKSPKIKEVALRQDNNKRKLSSATTQLILLSNKNFYISSNIAKLLGTANQSMGKGIDFIEQGVMHKTKLEFITSLKNINHVIELLLITTNKIQNSDSISGMDAYLEQLENMSQQQQGVNQSTMQLGNMGMLSQQQMIEKLKQEQQSLQNKLQKLLEEYSELEGGGLSKAKDDMEEIINDFENNNISRETIDRQQKILSRMINSQKSIRQKDYSEKRKSKIGKENIFDGPNDLIFNENKNFYDKAMGSALDEGFSFEYQTMMKKYFKNLKNETDNK